MPPIRRSSTASRRIDRQPSDDLAGAEYDAVWDVLARLWRSAERNGWAPRRSVPSTPLSPAITHRPAGSRPRRQGGSGDLTTK